MNWSSQISLAFQLLDNAALLAVGTVGYCELRHRFHDRLPSGLQAVLYGALFGVLGILVSLAPAITAVGYPITLRIVVIVVATLYCGVAAGAMATLLQVAHIAFLQLQDSALGLAFVAVLGFVLSAAYRTLLVPRDGALRIGELSLVAIATMVAIMGAVAWLRGLETFAAGFALAGPALLIMFVLSVISLGAVIRHIDRGHALAVALSDSERRFRAFYNETPVMLAAVDWDGRIAAASDRWLEFMGYAREEVIGKSRHEFLMPSSATQIQNDVLPVLRRGDPMPEVELQLTRKDGTLVDVGVTFALTKDPVTGTEQVLGFTVDQTARKRAERALKERESDLRAIVDHAPFTIFLKDREGRYRLVNRRFEQATGIEAAEIIGRTDAKALGPDLAEQSRATDLDVLERGETCQFERQPTRRRVPDEYILVTKFPIRDSAQQISGIAGFAVDITERRRAEAALSESRELLLESQRLGRLGYIVTDLVNDRVRWSESLFDIRGVARREAFSFSETIAFVHPDDRAAYLKVRSAAIAERRNFEFDARILRGDGSIGWEHAIGRPRYDRAGNCVSLLVVVQDITDRKRAEEALRGKEADLRAIMDNAPFAIFLKDRGGRYRLINRTYTDWFGDRPEDLIGRKAAEVYPEELVQKWDEIDRELMRTGQINHEERRVQQAKLGIEYTLTTKFPIRDQDGAMIGFAGIVADITDRKRAEEALQQSEGRFRALIEHSNDMVNVIAEDGTLTYRSPANAEVLGYRDEGLVGSHFLDRVHPDDVPEITGAIAALKSGARVRATGRSRVRHQSGAWRTIAWSARDARDVPGIEGVIVNSRDVTEAEQLEKQLQESQKMDAIGQLAGGVAHDFNNILGAILGFAGFLLQDLSPDTTDHGFAERIVGAAERGKELVQQVLAFSRHSSVERKPTDLGGLVREARELLRASVPASTRLRIKVSETPVVADVNGGQVTQILVNLCLNANEALEGEPGHIAVSLSRAEADDLASGSAESLVEAADPGCVVIGTLQPEKSYARIAVTDTGVGMSPEVLQHIFDPFFTTKRRGRGTGLGLSVVHGIVMAYEGALVVTSRPGAGSVFEVYFPLSDARPELLAPAMPVSALCGRERVLVVDDEPMMTDVLTTGLHRLGYESVAVNDAGEAIKLFTENPTAWDIVISDQVMPEMKGLALCQAQKKIRPTLRFILCTGFSEGLTEDEALAGGADAFFLKPVRPEEIAASIRKLFQRDASAADEGLAAKPSTYSPAE